jgi:hypothetical protein
MQREVRNDPRDAVVGQGRDSAAACGCKPGTLRFDARAQRAIGNAAVTVIDGDPSLRRRPQRRAERVNDWLPPG